VVVWGVPAMAVGILAALVFANIFYKLVMTPLLRKCFCGRRAPRISPFRNGGRRTHNLYPIALRRFGSVWCYCSLFSFDSLFSLLQMIVSVIYYDCCCCCCCRRWWWWSTKVTRTTHCSCFSFWPRSWAFVGKDAPLTMNQESQKQKK
jgi:hypothetical protein